ncbi:MAG: archaeosortase A [Candidatus Methanospirareceae archaeon]
MKSVIPFIAIVLFFLALVFRKRGAGGLGWLFLSIYCSSEVAYYFSRGEYFDASLALLFLAFMLLLTAIMLRPAPGIRDKGDEELFFTITKIALITAVFYFPIAEIPYLETLLIYVTTKITTAVLNLFSLDVYMVSPSSIYPTTRSFHEKPIEIILACTAIQSIVLFTGLVFGVTAPLGRKFKAFLVSVPTIYVLNILRNVFVSAAYFEQWFGSPLQSFYIAHGIIARIFVMISLIAIAYAVFLILPEALDLIESFFRFILRKRHV